MEWNSDLINIHKISQYKEIRLSVSLLRYLGTELPSVLAYIFNVLKLTGI